ncbi:ABC transporter ATP-binding protein, partial [Enterococcus faecalis]
GRFYDATKGTFYIDRKDAKSYSVRKLRENISMLMQDVFLFSNTIEDNITFGNTLANLEQVQMMPDIADAHSFISRMTE